MDQKILIELLHPVRMQILQKLANNEQCTSRQLSLSLPEVAQASLYRHLKAMLNANVLEVVSETQVRGTIEKSYRIKNNPFREFDEQGAAMEHNKVLNLFFTFIIAQLTDCSEYLSKEKPALDVDGFGFRTFLLNLNDKNLTLFIDDLKTLLQRYTQNEGELQARVHKFSFSLIPNKPS